MPRTIIIASTTCVTDSYYINALHFFCVEQLQFLNCACPFSRAAEEEASWTLTIVVIVALIACSLVLIMVIGYFIISRAIRQRNYDDAVAEFLAQDVRIVQPGLSDEALSLHPTIPAPTPASGDPENCSVCMEPMAPGAPCRQLLPCRHIFHVECADTWLGRSTVCPMCRADLRTEGEQATANAALARAAARFEQRTGLAPRLPPQAAAVLAAGVPQADGIAPGTDAQRRVDEPPPASDSRDRDTVIELAPLPRPPATRDSPTAGVATPPTAARSSRTPRPTNDGVRGGGAAMVSSSRPTSRGITPTTIFVTGSVPIDGGDDEFALYNDSTAASRIPRPSNTLSPPPRMAGQAAPQGRTSDAQAPLTRHIF